ncbi:MAG: endolytic transglycosylase MltG, partial [Algiphilus sp.]
DNPYALLTMASIIEKETGAPEERGRVAGVFTRRLQRGMRLQTDPTVLYGRDPERSGRLRRIDLVTDTPYNTYTRGGLPPTPICLPGRASLQAAANPAEGTALYFVSRNDGTHVFSDTLAEHNRAVNRYQRGGGE